MGHVTTFYGEWCSDSTPLAWQHYTRALTMHPSVILNMRLDKLPVSFWSF